jgi:hypothetical protein
MCKEGKGIGEWWGRLGVNATVFDERLMDLWKKGNANNK